MNPAGTDVEQEAAGRKIFSLTQQEHEVNRRILNLQRHSQNRAAEGGTEGGDRVNVEGGNHETTSVQPTPHLGTYPAHYN